MLEWRSFTYWPQTSIGMKLRQQKTARVMQCLKDSRVNPTGMEKRAVFEKTNGRSQLTLHISEKSKVMRMGYSLILTAVELYQKSHYCRLNLQEIFLFEAFEIVGCLLTSRHLKPLCSFWLPSYSGRPQIWNCLYSWKREIQGSRKSCIRLYKSQ